jgi:hypothetical protein
MKKSRRKNNLLFLLGGLLFLFSCSQVGKKNVILNNLNYQSQISILSPKDVKEFVEERDTFPISARKAYVLLNKQEKVQEILADTQHYQRKLLIDAYPTNKKKKFSISVREFIDARASIIASFSVNAYTGAIFFEPKPFSEAYENGLWKIPIEDWDSELE